MKGGWDFDTKRKREWEKSRLASLKSAKAVEIRLATVEIVRNKKTARWRFFVMEYI